MNLDFYKMKGILIELLITEQCNFYCEHCMYDCGPKKSSAYMSEDVLNKVKIQVEFLKKLGINVTINIIGGEPTLNLNKFKNILETVYEWDTNITISTNGWWLGSEESTYKFFSIVSKYASPDGATRHPITGRYFIVRVSDDPYHEKIRKIKNINYALRNILSSDNKKYSDLNMPKINLNDSWIFGQPWKNGYYYIAPNGRGKDITNIDYYLEEYGQTICFRDIDKGIPESIHYNPQGEVVDTCGYGSIYSFGTVDDNLLFIIQLILEYKKERRLSGKIYNCNNCREMVSEWASSNLIANREKFKKLNTFNIRNFLCNTNR